MSTYDLIALSLFLLQYAGYQFAYLYFSGRRRWITRESIISRYRKEWLEVIVEQNNPILAIQTIRNLEMVNTFLISLVMLMIGGIISIFSSQVDWLLFLEEGNHLAFLQSHPVGIKLLVVLSLLLIALFNFIFAVKICYNMNFTASCAVRSGQYEFQIEQVQRQARHFITGIRALYHVAIPLVWIIDTTAMIVLTLLSAFIFFRFDFLKGISYKEAGENPKERPPSP